MTLKALCRDQQGAALVTGVIFAAILMVIGSTAYMTASTELMSSRNYRFARAAFYQAEAGVNYAISRIQDDILNKKLFLKYHPAEQNYAVSLENYRAPDGFSFEDITTLVNEPGTRRYSFEVTVNEIHFNAVAVNARSMIKVVIERDVQLEYGIFGDVQVDLKEDGHIYSHASGSSQPPAPENSTGKGHVGSNGTIFVDNTTYIDGNLGLGDDGAGTEARLDKTAGGEGEIKGDVFDVARINPDPLGAVGGGLAADFETYRDSINNDNSTAPIGGDALDLLSGQTVTLSGKAGGANFYLTRITLEPGATLEIDATAGPVNIYLDGPLSAQMESRVNMTGPPPNITIYSKSSETIAFHNINSAPLMGTIYAPYANITIMNTGDFYGQVWGKTVNLKNAGNFYFDTALLDRWPLDTVSIVSWKDVRN
jgi:hypothetical protein